MATFGPRPPSSATFALRILGALAGGVIGTLCLFGVFVLSSGFSSEDSVRVLSVFVLLILVLVGSLVTNLVTTFFITYFDREMYPRYLTILSQSFILQIAIFLCAFPLYTILNSLALSGQSVGYFAAFHFFISVVSSALVMEILASSVYKMVAVYAITISALLTFGVILIMNLSGLENFVFFILAPILWVSIEFFRSIADTLYYYFYKFYGIDALSSETMLEEETTEVPSE